MKILRPALYFFVLLVVNLFPVWPETQAQRVTTPTAASLAANQNEEPVTTGKFEPSWDSLTQYETPEWFRDAKFGIWAHWTAQCVPEQGDWYAKQMYLQHDIDKKTGQDKGPQHDYTYQVEHYGHPSKVGFKDIDHLWKAENWDPVNLVALYKKAGAKYFVALANHHDNLDCYDSKYQEWNTMKVGPHKDIVGGWAKATRDAGLRFGVTVHAARTWDWFDISHGADTTGPLAGVPYDGNLTKADGKGQWWDGLDPAELYGPAGAARTPAARQAYNLKFFNRTMDLINKYKPDLLYFDDGGLPLINQSPTWGLKIAAHLYNSSTLWHGQNEAIMNTKGLREKERKCLVRDIERGKNDVIDPNVWQTDTCIGGWHYSKWVFDNHRYKKVADVIPMLVDIVSKNGNLLLNVPLKGDGTADSDEIAFLEEMAKWMAINGEGIYATRPWKIYGEGPSTVAEAEKGSFGGQKDVSSKPFTAEDIRFTVSKDGKTIHVIALGWPAGGKLIIKSLAKNSPNEPGEFRSVKLLGHDKELAFTRDEAGLTITVPEQKPCDYAYVFDLALR
jgi:alpha-L-fucosidase